MSLSETRKEFHHLIDSISDHEMLSKLFDVVARSISQTEGQLWNTLSDKEKQEVLNSYYESLSGDNLIPHEEMIARYKKWLKK